MNGEMHAKPQAGSLAQSERWVTLAFGDSDHDDDNEEEEEEEAGC